MPAAQAFEWLEVMMGSASSFFEFSLSCFRSVPNAVDLLAFGAGLRTSPSPQRVTAGGGNKSGISAHFTHILTVTISGTMEPGHWATTGN